MALAFEMEEDDGTFNLEMLNGIRFSRHLFAGVGVEISACMGDERLIIPLFLDVKGYLPVSGKTDLVAGIDAGTKLDYYYGMSGGLMLRPEFGLHFQFNEKLGLNLTLFYERYSYNMRMNDVKISTCTNNIGLRLGFHF